MPFNEKRPASIKNSSLDMLLGDPSTRHVYADPHAIPPIAVHSSQPPAGLKEE